MSEIGRRLYISKPYMTALIDTMAGEGLVEQQPDQDNWRAIHVVITRKGQEHIESMAARMKDRIRGRLPSLDDPNLARLCRSLSELRQVLEKIPER